MPKNLTLEKEKDISLGRDGVLCESPDSMKKAKRIQFHYLEGNQSEGVPPGDGESAAQGLAFGILAQKAGFDVLEIALMSVVVFAGSSQFIAAGSFGIDYALSAMFLCQLTFQLRGRIYVLTAIISGALAIAVSLLLPGNFFVIIASLLGATAGFAIKRYAQRERGSYA